MSKNRTPVRLCCGQEHMSIVCPDGKVMCQLCFDRFEEEDLYVDDKGQRWDVCKQCQAHEDEMMRRRQSEAR